MTSYDRVAPSTAIRDGGSDDVAAVAAEVDVRGGHLPAPLLLAADVGVVGVEPARRRAHKPCPRVAEALAACSLEGSEAAGRGVDVDVDDKHSGGPARGQSDVRVRGALPPPVYDVGDRGRVVEAVRRQWLLPPGMHGNTWTPRLA